MKNLMELLELERKEYEQENSSDFPIQAELNPEMSRMSPAQLGDSYTKEQEAIDTTSNILAGNIPKIEAQEIQEPILSQMSQNQMDGNFPPSSEEVPSIESLTPEQNPDQTPEQTKTSQLLDQLASMRGESEENIKSARKKDALVKLLDAIRQSATLRNAGVAMKASRTPNIKANKLQQLTSNYEGQTRKDVDARSREVQASLQAEARQQEEQEKLNKKENFARELVELKLDASKEKDEAKKAQLDEKTKKAEEAAKKTVIDSSQFLIRDAETALDVIKNSGNLATGFGSLSKGIPLTPARELSSAIKSIQGNVGVNQLMDLKKSNVGLGQIPQSQFDMLSNLLGNLDQGLPPEKLSGLVSDIKNLYTDIVKNAGGDPEKLTKKATGGPIKISVELPDGTRGRILKDKADDFLRDNPGAKIL